ncbi:MAG: SIMPL domain-containing protein [Rhodobacteraceae bacterium]|nr:SIMPL domain-containing protein [Paracoccaceae bacterium]
MRKLASLFMVIVLLLPASTIHAEETRATVTVTGEGRVDVTPDMATLSLGVNTEADTAKAALDLNSAQLAKVLEGLKNLGIEPRDIQTSGLSLGPRYDYNSSNSGPKLVGYVASNVVTVRIRALDTLGGVLDGVVAEGANTLNGLSFGLQDTAGPTDEARRRAVADARHRAELYAEAAGVKLGTVLSISEQMGMSQPMPMMMAEAAMTKGAGVPVEAGELTLATTLTVVYEIAR